MLGHEYAGNKLCIRAGQGLGFSSVEHPRGYCRSQTSRHRCRRTSVHSALLAAACHIRPAARGVLLYSHVDKPIPHGSTIAYKRTLLTVQNTCSQLWQRWQDSSPLAPQLYLYSSADALIPPDRIKAFMASQVRRLLNLPPLSLPEVMIPLGCSTCRQSGASRSISTTLATHRTLSICGGTRRSTQQRLTTSCAASCNRTRPSKADVGRKWTPLQR